MRKYRRGFALGLLLISSSAMSFNGHRCNRFLMKGPMFRGLTTVSQFTSSTGECSAVGMKDDMQKKFFVENYDNLMKDFSRGTGEYANGFFKLSSCGNNAKSIVIRNIRTQFSNLIDLNEEESFLQIKDLIQKNCGNV